MKDRLFHHATIAKMLDDDALEERRGNAGIPDTLRIHHHDRSAGAHAETGSLAALHPARTEEQTFALEQTREGSVQRSALAVRRAEPTDAHKHVARIRLHDRSGLARSCRHAA